MAERSAAWRLRWFGSPLAVVVALGLSLRLIAADVVHFLTLRTGTRCLFADTEAYWRLAGALLRGTSYEISQWGIPHKALRTPGYPLFLAGCRWIFGDRTLPVRLVQAVIASAAAVLVAHLARALLMPPQASDRQKRRVEAIAIIAALLYACDPGQVGISVLILSEALYIPLLLLAACGIVALVRPPAISQVDGTGYSNKAYVGLAAAVGGLLGASVLVRPSGTPLALLWIAFTPFFAPRLRRRRLLGLSGLMILGMASVMAPWWIRNAVLLGEFVPTASWGGASLYDGLNPRADGSSNMDFLNEKGLWSLDELGQDRELTRRALEFAREHPGRVLSLALQKAGRYWSPLPLAEAGAPRVLRWSMALAAIPLYLAALLGLWDRRRDALAIAVSAGPVLVFALLHMIFVGSARYRMAAFPTAYVPAALGFVLAYETLSKRSKRRPASAASV